MSNPFVPVRLHGNLLYVELDVLEGRQFDGGVALPEHITDGQLNNRAFDTDTYAHIFGDEVVRYGVTIAAKSDLTREASDV